MIMNNKTDISKQTTAPAAESGDIMQSIQDMIGDLLKNTVDKMQKTEVSNKLGDTPSDESGKNDLTPQMGIAEVKNFIYVMQKFIDNVSVMVTQLETGVPEPGGTDDKFLDSYMATADNVLEIAAFSTKDTITGLSNRYGFDNRLILEWNRAIRDKSTLGLVIFSSDILAKPCDNVKRDDLLKAVSETLEKSIKRSTDFTARWSDEEFAALLPITDVAGTSIVVERIRMEIGNMDIPGVSEKDGKASVSIGVCVHGPKPDDQPAEFIKKAHDAYTKAKEAGGDSIIFC